MAPCTTVHSTSLAAYPMDRPAKAKLASLLKKRQRTASSASASSKRAAATASKHSPSSSSSPPTNARASSISSPDAHAKAIDLLVQALCVVDGEKTLRKKGAKKGAEAAGQGDKKEEKEATNTTTTAAGVAMAAAGKKKNMGDVKKDVTAGKEAAAPALPDASASPFSESRVREAATEIEEALHDLWKAGNHHEYNNKLRHLVFNLHRNDALRKKVLDGSLPPTKLLSLPIEALRTDAERDAAKAMETKEILGYSHSHVFSDVIFEEAAKGVAGMQGGEGEGMGGKCRQCESTKVLFSRRQSYNESSTWCGEEQGVPVMMNCLSCGTVESIRE